MAVTLKTTMRVILHTLLQDELDNSHPRDRLALVFADELLSGAGADQADMVWHDRRTLAPLADDSLDLAGGLTDGLGRTLTFKRVKGIFIANRSAAGTLSAGGGANPFATWVLNAGDGVIVRAGGCILAWSPDATGYVVTADTGDKLLLHNESGASLTYDIVLIGASA